MTPESAGRRATYDDLRAVPDNLVAEIVDGELITSPRPAIPHAHVASVLGMDVGGAFQRGRGGPGGWWILDEPELHLGADVLVPDLAGWRRERMVALPSEPFLAVSPDWVCEVLSPNTASLDRVRKLRIYAREKVSHAWLIDPAGRTIEVLRRQDDRWLLVATHADTEQIRAEPFDAIEIDLGALWMVPTETAPTR